jgi:membrane-associated protease RseP (regulator of RpoE activity)
VPKGRNVMTEIPGEIDQAPSIKQADFEKITQIVSAHFQTEEAFLGHGIPTYFLKQSQETKQAFLRLLKKLESMSLIAFLRRIDGRIVLRVVPKPAVKSSNVLVNWVLLFATIGTTFVTGYLLMLDFVDIGVMSNPFIGGAAFTIAIMAVLGSHEMGHKLTANRNGVDATPPYFIPGPPPIGEVLGFGTFGAVMMQKSLPPNRDALFDIGSSGPIVGFTVAFIASIVGLMLSPVLPIKGNESLVPSPLVFDLFAIFLLKLPADHYVLFHPVAFAGWAGMIVTMLNLLPVAMLDGGHAARSVFGEKGRTILTVLSVLFLAIGEFWSMVFLVLFMSTYRHPGPLDDVSSLSTGRKLLAIVLVAIFILCSYVHYWILYLLGLLGL